MRYWQLGLYGFAVGMSVVMIAATLIFILTGRFSRLTTAATVLVVGLSWGLITAKTDEATEVGGVNASDVDPELIRFVEEVASAVGAPMPDAIHVVATAELGFVESTRRFGHRLDSRVLVVGLPMLEMLTRSELAALLAAGFGKDADLGIAHGPEALRSLRAARSLIEKERQGFINGVYGSYARKMFRSVGGVGVAQEAAADRRAVELYGAEALDSALAKWDDIIVGFDQYLRDYVAPALAHGIYPEDLMGGFANMMQSTARYDERAARVDKRRSKKRTEFDLQLDAPERRDRLRGRPFAAGSVDLDEAALPANTLLDPDAKSSEVVAAAWANSLVPDHPQATTWPELVDRAYVPEARDFASVPFLDGLDTSEQLEQAFDWSAAGEWDAADRAIKGPRRGIKDPLKRRIAWARCLVTVAAADAGTFTWEHNWDGPPRLVAAAGTMLDEVAIATLIVEGRASEARQAFAGAVAAS